MSEHVAIRSAEPADAVGIALIYNHYVAQSVATFEEVPVSSAEMARRMESVHAASLPWLVADESNRVAGYACASNWRTRSAYRFSVEATVYVDPALPRRGIGSRLYTELFAALERCGVHAVMGGISLPNAASIALHEKFGMQKVAHFREVGFKFGGWVDVGYWERILREITAGEVPG